MAKSRKASRKASLPKPNTQFDKAGKKVAFTTGGFILVPTLMAVRIAKGRATKDDRTFCGIRAEKAILNHKNAA